MPLGQQESLALPGLLYSLTKRCMYDEVVSRDGKVALVKWYENRPVVMASNFVGVGRIDEAQVKRPNF